MRDEEEVIFTNQTGTFYPPKPLNINASAHTDRSEGKRHNYAHLSLVESVDFILKDRQGDQAIRAGTDKGIRMGWDPGIPIGHMRTKQSNAMMVLDAVATIRHPTVESSRLVCTQAHSDKIQVADQLELTQFRQWKDRQQHHKLMESQTPDPKQDRTGSHGKQVGSKHGSIGDKNSHRRP